MILHSCGVLQHNSRCTRAGFVSLLALDCVKGWVGPRPGLLRGMLHCCRGDLLFCFFKGFPASPPQTPRSNHSPIHKKPPQKTQVDVDGIYKSTPLMIVLPLLKGFGETNHITNTVYFENVCTLSRYSQSKKKKIWPWHDGERHLFCHGTYTQTQIYKTDCALCIWTINPLLKGETMSVLLCTLQPATAGLAPMTWLLPLPALKAS